MIDEAVYQLVLLHHGESGPPRELLPVRPTGLMPAGDVVARLALQPHI